MAPVTSIVQDSSCSGEGLDVNELSWRSENVYGLVSFPIIHDALSLHVPVLIIWGGRKREENDQGLTEAHLTTRANCLAGWTHMATTEMELLHSNIDF